MKSKKLAKFLCTVLPMVLAFSACGAAKPAASTAPSTSVAASASTAPSASSTPAVAYPTKPIHVIVPMSAGGPSDLAARAMEKLAAKHLGQPLIVENKVGGGGTLGYNEIAHAAPDGYTLGLAATNMILQPLYGGTEFDYHLEFTPLAQAVSNPIAVAVLADSPVQTLEDLVKYTTEHPSELNYAYTNVGSLPHVVSAMFVSQSGAKMEPIPFQGGADSLTAFLGNNVQVCFTQISELKSHAADGKVRVLAIATEERLPAFPDVPTFKEKKMDIVSSTWFGMVAPKGLPEDIKATLFEGFKNIINDDEFKKTAENLGYQFDYLNSEELAKKWNAEAEAYGKAITESGIGEEMARQAGKK